VSQLPPVGPSSTNAGKATVTFVIGGSPTQSSKRRNLPSGTQSVSVGVLNFDGSTIAAFPTPVVFNVSASAPGCSAISGGFQCSEAITAPVGTVLFDATGYSAPNAGGSVLVQGIEYADVMASGSTPVTITTSNQSVYTALSLEGSLTIVLVNHATNTFNLSFADGNSASGTITPLSNGDLQLQVTSATNSDSTNGSIGYAREIPGAMLTFASGGTSPPANGIVASGGDWAVGAGIACATTLSTAQVSVVIVGGPTFSNTASAAGVTGTATVTPSGSTYSFAFNGTGYNVSGASIGAQTGTNTCSVGGPSMVSGTPVAIGPFGTLLIGSGNPGSNSSDTDGGVGFAYKSLVSPNVASLTAQTYDGFFGSYSGGGTMKQSGPIQLTPAGNNTLNLCAYASFPSTPSTPGSAGCGTVAINATQPIPGLLLGTVTPPAALGGGTSPTIATAAQVNGKWVILGINDGGGNFAVIQH